MLRLENICLGLGTFQLRNICLHVEKGQYMVLLGPTGAGKTVLLDVIAGLHSPDEGKIFLKGEDATDLAPEARRLGVVYQDYALFPHLTVFGNIAFGLRLKGESKQKVHDAVVEMARFMEIDSIMNRRPGHLSGGERQRVALARALVLKPNMLLLDEPLSALDRSTRDRLKRELKRIHSEIGVSILHVTHDLSEAFFLADCLGVMKNGALVQEGRPQEIISCPKNLFVAELLGIENLIPAKVGEGGKRLFTDLGQMDASALSIRPAEDQKNGYLTIPGWAVDLFPEKGNGPYLWKGELGIVNLNLANGHMEIELAHESGKHLRTSLSRREVVNLPACLELGTEVTVGLLQEGMYWVP
ncbi:MAG: ATP-binding cassette domain-containing protein [Deltaproteobacteria bacterium]|nr:ATP-binding cassette domain-containing protein [Deltaproteobacteria bacterium]